MVWTVPRRRVNWRRLARSASVQGLLWSVALQLTLLLSGVLAARILGPTERGTLALFWVIGLTLVQFGSLGLNQSIAYEISAKHRSVASIVRVVRPIFLAQVLALGAVQSIALALLFSGRTAETLAAAALTLAFVPSQLILSYAGATAQGSQRFGWLHALRLTPLVGYSAALCVGFAMGTASLVFVTAAWVLPHLVCAMTVGLALRRGVWTPSANASSDAPDPGEMVRYGLNGMLGSVSATETLRADQFVVGIALSERDLGLYSTALACANLPRFFAMSIGFIAFPRVAASSSPDEQRRTLWRYVTIGSAVALVTTAPLILLAETLVLSLFGNDFAGAVGPARVLLVAAALVSVRRVLSDGVRAAGHPRDSSFAELSAWICLLPAVALLGSAAGVVGVAYALVISYAASLAVLLILAVRRGLAPLRPAARR